MTAEIRLLGPDDRAVLDRVAPDVFDNPIDPRWAAEFLADARHHLALALDGDLVVGMASAVHYVHPDKPPELWINEVGVAAAYQQQGIGGRLLRALFDRARELGCREAWVLTDWENEAARRLYASVEGREEPPDGAVLVTFELRPAES
jgi:aminoglycoside 6'-N-acetyltransferase I